MSYFVDKQLKIIYLVADNGYRTLQESIINAKVFPLHFLPLLKEKF